MKKNTEYQQSIKSSSDFDSGVISVFRFKNGNRAEQEEDFRFDKNVFSIENTGPKNILCRTIM